MHCFYHIQWEVFILIFLHNNVYLWFTVWTVPFMWYIFFRLVACGGFCVDVCRYKLRLDWIYRAYICHINVEMSVLNKLLLALYLTPTICWCTLPIFSPEYILGHIMSLMGSRKILGVFALVNHINISTTLTWFLKNWNNYYHVYIFHFIIRNTYLHSKMISGGASVPQI